MSDKKYVIHISQDRICLLAVFLGILTLLLSEELYYIGLTEHAVISGIPKTVVFFIVALCAILLSINNKHIKTRYKSLLKVFTVIMIISTIFGVTAHNEIWRQCIHLTIFLAAFSAFYTCTLFIDPLLSKRYLKIMLLIIVGLYVLTFLSDGVKFQNAVYFAFMFLPVISMIESKLLRKILYILIVIFVLISSKRTALISMVTYFFAYEIIGSKQENKRAVIVKIIIYICLLFILYFSFPYIMDRLNLAIFKEMSMANIKETGGSNRMLIYTQMWNKQCSEGVKHWLIGEGYNSVLLSQICTDGIGGNWVSAHNDVLEVLFDYGLIGLFTYIAFFKELITTAISMIRNRYHNAASFGASLVMVISISLTSHLVIYLNYYIIIFIFWAICLAEYNEPLGCVRKLGMSCK